MRTEGRRTLPHERALRAVRWLAATLLLISSPDQLFAQSLTPPNQPDKSFPFDVVAALAAALLLRVGRFAI